MRVPLANLTPDQIKRADFIETIDTNQPPNRQLLWGQGVVGPMRPYPCGPHSNETLEVEIDSNQPAQQHGLIRQVEAVKGCLHPEVEKLKK
jgi:hypothetical protein